MLSPRRWPSLDAFTSARFPERSLRATRKHVITRRPRRRAGCRPGMHDIFNAASQRRHARASAPLTFCYRFSISHAEFRCDVEAAARASQRHAPRFLRFFDVIIEYRGVRFRSSPLPMTSEPLAPFSARGRATITTAPTAQAHRHLMKLSRDIAAMIDADGSSFDRRRRQVLSTSARRSHAIEVLVISLTAKPCSLPPLAATRR